MYNVIFVVYFLNCSVQLATNFHEYVNIELNKLIFSSILTMGATGITFR